MTTITPGNFNFTVYQGYTLGQQFFWTDQNNNPIDLTGYNSILDAKYSLTDTNPFLSLSTSNGGITLGGTAGTITLAMSTAQTSALTPGIGIYNLQITDSLGNVNPLMYGTLIVQQLPTP